MNDLVWRALGKVNITSVKEPSGLSKSDGKRPEGMTLIPWKMADASLTHWRSHACYPHRSQSSGGAAEAAADRKTSKYSQLAQT